MIRLWNWAQPRETGSHLDQLYNTEKPKKSQGQVSLTLNIDMTLHSGEQIPRHRKNEPGPGKDNKSEIPFM